MAKMTLLELTQDILNDLNSDEVNSIDDTSESAQVAQIIKSTYFSLIDGRNWPHTQKLVQILPSGSSQIPTIMTLQDVIKEISFVNYNKAKISDGSRLRYEEVKYLEQEDFLRYCNNRDNTAANNALMIDPYSGISFTIRNDTAPTYYSSYDDVHLIFDSYDKQMDSTLQQSKVQVYAYVIPEWVHQDTAYPFLPDDAFTYLLEEAKSRASFKIRQQPDQKAEQESQRQKKWLARRDRRIGQGIKFPDYGRVGRFAGSPIHKDPTFRRDN